MGAEKAVCDRRGAGAVRVRGGRVAYAGMAWRLGIGGGNAEVGGEAFGMGA